ncbi:growth hormone receptor-like isoform X2 [Nelusetta ayraudi]|uniref:growth hormone receptor-like isoform X2 n=2 Tax=Nelusetta ayraudi TaxID=303726 RepID=UPI003F711856
MDIHSRIICKYFSLAFSAPVHSMAAALHTFILLHLLTAAALDLDSDQVQPQTPHLTGCASADMVTFRCRWNVGASQSASEAGDLRLFFKNKVPYTPPTGWTECPHYSADAPHECFFNENHTTVWTTYTIQLRSSDQAVLYDESHFHVQDIVRPDPPVNLNWMLLNVSLTSSYFDAMLNWVPPHSADVKMGWLTLQYQVQYRDNSTDKWTVLEPVQSTHCSLYGLQTNVMHEVRVRCKMLGGKEFGEFSDSVFIHIPSKASHFPTVALLVFGSLCFVVILALVVISQQAKLMFILLPPVPGPKIKGIDSDLLKKGKLRELTSILCSPPDLRPELYNSDPWVEFIDLDIEEQCDRLTDLDTDCLMHRSLSSNGAALTVAFRDDDSGRASCCDPDLPSDPETSPFHPLIPNQSLSGETAPVQTPAAGEPMYTQVSEVKPSGKVLLTPEEQSELEGSHGRDAALKRKVEEKEFQLVVLDPRGGDYTSELGKTSSASSAGGAGEPREAGGGSGSSPPTLPQVPPPDPTAAYTMVEAVDRQNSLLLTPNSTPAPLVITAKTLPTPTGYLTPDLLGSIAP